MPTEKKVETMAELKERMKDNTIAVATQYKGVTVAQVTELRKRFREQRIEFKVYKNTLVKRVLAELGWSAAEQYIEGPTAWAFSKDPVAPAKILKEFSKEVPAIAINGGILEGRALNKAEVEMLAKLPPREVLLGQVVGMIAAPLQGLLGALNGVPRNLVNVLDQIRKQKEESAAA